MKINRYIELSHEAESALNEGGPVVALESTIISHGMPYPQNLETARVVENEVRAFGAVPATVAIMNGKIKIGLSDEDLQLLSAAKNILKASRRDLPTVVAGKLSAATTVSATMICARLAGIELFATGGIGGVHRNAAQTFDISADLTEFAETSVAVVSSGVKSILDIGLTLEYLETLGVPVIGYRTEEFPAFYTRQSGFKVDYRIDSPEEIAAVISAKQALGLEGGILIANPVPEEYSFGREEIDEAIESALRTADEHGIKGKEVTPFLLKEIVKITQGSSLKSNIELVKSNAALAAQISCCLADPKRRQP